MWTAVFNNYMHHANDMMIFFLFFLLLQYPYSNCLNLLLERNQYNMQTKKMGKTDESSTIQSSIKTTCIIIMQEFRR